MTRTEMLSLWQRVKKNSRCIVYSKCAVTEWEDDKAIAIGFRSNLGEAIPVALYDKATRVMTWLDYPLTSLPNKGIAPRFTVYMVNLPDKLFLETPTETWTLTEIQMAARLASDYETNYASIVRGLCYERANTGRY